ncbi:hypothetical protein ARALYDRAFT_902921 [Arabidopsis lyrata subsp. lyrata]|uniref:Uncharacterized protein n=1 Tax=Arabidopsis lyrata subsp. lyrata TaxID=81972 RepID=D7LKC7_ARALL|nr:hypothetical protein ARALYDRAFT_902921 [Arabidopsis lyrata subsp. lyrata]
MHNWVQASSSDFSGTPPQARRLGDFCVLDTDIWQWSELTSFGDLPTARDFAAASAIGNQKIVLKSVKHLDGVWTQLKLPGQAPSSRCGHTVTSGGHYLLLFGGHGTGGWLSRYYVYYNDTIILDRAYHTMTGIDGKLTFGDLWWLVPEDDPIAKRSSVPQLINPPEINESERELDKQERGQEGYSIVELQKKMGISVSSGLRLQSPNESEDQEFVELGTRLIEGDVADSDWKESTPRTLQLKELGSLLGDYQRLVTRKFATQSSLTSADFGLPGTKTFMFYHIKSSSQEIPHDFLL